jgi:hypothetical protein
MKSASAAGVVTLFVLIGRQFQGDCKIAQAKMMTQK